MPWPAAPPMLSEKSKFPVPMNGHSPINGRIGGHYILSPWLSLPKTPSAAKILVFRLTAVIVTFPYARRWPPRDAPWNRGRMEFLVGAASASAARITAGFRLTPVGSTIGASVKAAAETVSLRHFCPSDKRLVLMYAASLLDLSASCSSLAPVSACTDRNRFPPPLGAGSPYVA